MYNADAFKLDLKGLKEEITVFNYALDDAYFEAIETPDVKRGTLKCKLTVRNAGTFYELNFHTEGNVIVQCDRCLDDMEQPINTVDRLVVKYGDEYSEEDDLITIVEDEGILDVSWFIYEFIELNIPIQHMHEPGKCNAEMMKLLNEHTSTRSGGEDEKETIDPRWSKLSELLDKN